MEVLSALNEELDSRHIYNITIIYSNLHLYIHSIVIIGFLEERAHILTFSISIFAFNFHYILM